MHTKLGRVRTDLQHTKGGARTSKESPDQPRVVTGTTQYQKHVRTPEQGHSGTAWERKGAVAFRIERAQRSAACLCLTDIKGTDERTVIFDRTKLEKTRAELPPADC